MDFESIPEHKGQQKEIEEEETKEETKEEIEIKEIVDSLMSDENPGRLKKIAEMPSSPERAIAIYLSSDDRSIRKEIWS